MGSWVGFPVRFEDFLRVIPANPRGKWQPAQAKSWHGEVRCSHSAHLTQPCCYFFYLNASARIITYIGLSWKVKKTFYPIYQLSLFWDMGLRIYEKLNYLYLDEIIYSAHWEVTQCILYGTLISLVAQVTIYTRLVTWYAIYGTLSNFTTK